MADGHLSWISTSWSLVRRAHESASDDAEAARQLLFERYGGAVRRFLTAVLRDADTAEELTQEFALELIRGGFRHADPERGRFRDYVKSSLIHLVGKHRQRERRQPLPLSPTDPALTTELAAVEDNDAAFDRHWATNCSLVHGNRWPRPTRSSTPCCVCEWNIQNCVRRRWPSNSGVSWGDF